MLFAFLNGEAFDYIGSSRMVYDMKENLFPKENKVHDDQQNALLNWPLINVQSLFAHSKYNKFCLFCSFLKILYFIIVEVGQLVNHNDNDIYSHVDEEFAQTGDGSNLMENLNLSAVETGLSFKKGKIDKLPPSSIHSVLKEVRSIPG